MTTVASTIPLALYVHYPWCVQKCPYCDFNSHQAKSAGIPEQAYIEHVLNDLANDLPLIKHQSQLREISSIFIGGGTPSMMSVESMNTLLNGIRKLVPIKQNAEITMEANPGTVETSKFLGFKQAGINRISIGVQSFQTKHLNLLGRIHNNQEASNAIQLAKSLNLRSFNVDLMHGLPQQNTANALSDLEHAIALNPPHLSWYQLTIEPNTLFYSRPPKLPQDDTLWEIQIRGQAAIRNAGYEQYEVSAYAQKGQQCQHNLNYWRYGDYLGIGCGAHGKITQLDSFDIVRTVKTKHPKGYMNDRHEYTYESSEVPADDRCFEFFMNRFRLLEPCLKEDFINFTGRQLTEQEFNRLDELNDKGLIISNQSTWQLTELGQRYLNSVLEVFV